MTNQTPPENTISNDAMSIISVAFAESYEPSIGKLTFEKLKLKNEMKTLLAHTANVEADNASLKIESANLVKAHIAFQSQIHEFQKELEDRPTLGNMREKEAAIEALEIKIGELIEAGPTVAQSAALDAAKVEARKEKAAP